MKDIIRMNQLAGLITEGQAKKMMRVLNEWSNDDDSDWMDQDIEDDPNDYDEDGRMKDDAYKKEMGFSFQDKQNYDKILNQVKKKYNFDPYNIKNYSKIENEAQKIYAKKYGSFFGSFNLREAETSNNLNPITKKKFDNLIAAAEKAVANKDQETLYKIYNQALKSGSKGWGYFIDSLVDKGLARVDDRGMLKFNLEESRLNEESSSPSDKMHKLMLTYIKPEFHNKYPKDYGKYFDTIQMGGSVKKDKKRWMDFLNKLAKNKIVDMEEILSLATRMGTEGLEGLADRLTKTPMGSQILKRFDQ